MLDMTETNRKAHHYPPVDEQLEMAAASLTNDAVALLQQATTSSMTPQRELAERLGVTESRVSQVLSGDGNIRLTTFARYLAGLGFRAEMKLVPLDEPLKKRNRRSKPDRTEKSTPARRVQIWQHRVVTENGSFPALVVAEGVEGFAHPLHSTENLLFDTSLVRNVHDWSLATRYAQSSSQEIGSWVSVSRVDPKGLKSPLTGGNQIAYT
jgi:transcriptional regulator with XRE-family HTH domain